MYSFHMLRDYSGPSRVIGPPAIMKYSLIASWSRNCRLWQLRSLAIGLWGCSCRRYAVLSSILLPSLQAGGWEKISRHHGRYFTAFAELNITNQSISIYVERNVFHKETSELNNCS